MFHKVLYENHQTSGRDIQPWARSPRVTISRVISVTSVLAPPPSQLLRRWWWSLPQWGQGSVVTSDLDWTTLILWRCCGINKWPGRPLYLSGLARKDVGDINQKFIWTPRTVACWINEFFHIFSVDIIVLFVWLYNWMILESDKQNGFFVLIQKVLCYTSTDLTGWFKCHKTTREWYFMKFGINNKRYNE